MIAYNHYIKFIPELKNNKQVDGSYTDTVTVKENKNIDLNDQLQYELSFFNNQGRDLVLYTDKKFNSIEKVELLAFEVKDVVTFYWHSNTLSLEYLPHKNFTKELLEYWCLHIVLPLFFTIEETFDFLHAGAIEVEGKPVLFIAESFGGKSTMTDYFMKKGHVVVSDDKVGIFEKEGKFYSVPSHPHHRPYRKMEDLGFFIKNFATKVQPIHVVYELEKVEKDAAIEILEVHGVEKFKSLRYASEMNLFFQKSKRFEFLMKMANMVHVYKVSVPWDMERLDDVYKKIVEHAQQLKPRT